MNLRVTITGIVVLPLALALAACDGSFEIAGRATD